MPQSRSEEYRRRGEETRKLAREIKYHHVRLQMFDIADRWDRMAQEIEKGEQEGL